ncbi:MAG: tyrosine-type recombinase/integrase [Puniceicoccales bacterium]
MRIDARKCLFFGQYGHLIVFVPRKASLEIRTKITKSGETRYWFTVPAGLSATGKRQRPEFRRKKLAELERERILAMNRRFGSEAVKLPGEVVADAARAMDILNGCDVTLASIALDYIERRKAAENSVTVGALWAEYLETKEGISDSYKKDLERYSVKVIPQIGKQLVCEIEPLAIEKAIGKAFKTPTAFNNCFRSLRPAWTLAVKRGYCEKHPFDRIDQRKKSAKAVSILSIEQVEKALAAAQTDFSVDKKMPVSYQLDCRDCLPAAALMIFAGIRPKEVTRLYWSDIHFDHGSVRIDNAASKTRSSRIVPMTDNLRAWLDLTPPELRKGPITPPRWGNKIKAIRYAAGISDTQDALRHSFASYHLGAHADMKGLQEAMGHSTPEMVLRHYRALVTKRDAIAFWSIRPNASEPQIREVVA